MTTAFITHSDCLKHETPPGHPEQVARLKYILEATKDLDLLRIEAPLATQKNILSVHPQSHIDLINANSPEDGTRPLDGDTHMSPGTISAAYRAAGGAVCAVDTVLSGKAKNAFVAVLKDAGLPVTANPENAVIQIFGKVEITDQALKRETIEINWIFLEPNGSEIGKMTQSNSVEKGRVHSKWGSLAYDVTFAMVDSVADVLLTMGRTEGVR